MGNLYDAPADGEHGDEAGPVPGDQRSLDNYNRRGNQKIF